MSDERPFKREYADPICPRCQGSLRVKTVFYNKRYRFPFYSCRECKLFLTAIKSMKGNLNNDQGAKGR